jgi:hypothetical protein
MPGARLVIAVLIGLNGCSLDDRIVSPSNINDAKPQELIPALKPRDWSLEPLPSDDAVSPNKVHDDSSLYCKSHSECAEGMLCSLLNNCEAVVQGCPPFDECLADPEGQAIDWDINNGLQGDDPHFLGSVGDDDSGCRMDVLIDFYPDHLYGEGDFRCSHWTLPPNYSFSFRMKGTRDGRRLVGQLFDQWSQRNFEATFSAVLVSGSEIRGIISMKDDLNFLTGQMQLFRISPCGCAWTQRSSSMLSSQRASRTSCEERGAHYI